MHTVDPESDVSNYTLFKSLLHLVKLCFKDCSMLLFEDLISLLKRTGNLILIKLEASFPNYPCPSQTAKKCL